MRMNMAVLIIRELSTVEKIVFGWESSLVENRKYAVSIPYVSITIKNAT
jgi:hypothetical protein